MKNAGYEKEETYRNYPSYTKYRTLWDPQYGAMYRHPKYTSPAGIKSDIDNLLNDIWKFNYANKVNFVAHSFGGLVARYYAEKNPMRVDKVITVGTPHLGTTAFYTGIFSEYSSLAEVETDLPEWAALRWVIPRYDCLDLKNQGSVTDLDHLSISSLFSNTLNAGYAPGVSYHSIYGVEYNTDRDLILVKTDDWYKQQGKIVKVLGDGYITAESARAFGTSYSVPGKKSTKHALLMNNGIVQTHILNILNTTQ
ncbi:alpha/beta fold hydrolase [candidate division KSB1 bacterium]|nr:alpha/beta fold hydrolase [candidate division KSB1 bacterium]